MAVQKQRKIRRLWIAEPYEGAHSYLKNLRKLHPDKKFVIPKEIDEYRFIKILHDNFGISSIDAVRTLTTVESGCGRKG